MSDEAAAPVVETAPAPAPVPAPIAAVDPLTPLLRADRQSTHRQLSDVLDAARAGTLDTAPVDGEPKPHHSTLQPRADGKFAGPPDASAAPLDGVAPVADDAPTDDAGDDEFVPFVLSGHQERGEDDIVLEFPNVPEVQERLKRLANDGMRKRDYDQAMGQVETIRNNVAAFETRVQLDPVAFVREYVPAEMLKPMILSYLTDPDVLDALRDDISVLDDEGQRRRVAAESQLALHNASRHAETQLATRAQNRQTTQQIDTALRAVVPTSLNEAQSEQWIGDAMRELATLVTNGTIDRRQLSAHQLPQLLGGRFQGWGVNDAAVRIAQALNPSPEPPAPSALRRSGSAVPAAAVPAPRNGANAPTPSASRPVADIKATNALRHAAAQTGGPGAGAPIAASLPPITGPGALERTLKAAKDRSRTPLLR